ncbi:putative GH43/DUF377 family glycosyl hydrolase [Streptosporangium album]|uniref:Putative GH43/DUF377 family glycosyl hydrolase n=1 Tax=Streptosporangium album TaxID=47479 RepID=A0A7W7RT69_9ACTN|nr:glycoside hydrolase family 130 protein [Streptosporangium album]MBB4937760.1 putative GH43/DUF377 family glycosyl hydrolase [Streptosporangium album]
MTIRDLATRLDLTLAPDPRRVIIKLFVPGEDAALARTRAAALIDRITLLSHDETAGMLRDTLRRFGGRHHDLEATFLHHYDLVRYLVPHHVDLRPADRLLVGAYFSHEYAVEAAALCNPSMVAHPDQSDLSPGQLRVVISMRQIGEGHLSSIGFATALLGPGTGLTVADRSGPLTVGRTTTPRILEELRRMTASDYTVAFPADVPLERRVLWPATAAESNGMEDARFVRVLREDGTLSYRATYTAYDGRNISSRMLDSDDLRRFEITPLRGPAAANKGMAVFPRPVGGRRLALCRSDGETIGLTVLDRHNRWQRPMPIHAPRSGWELVQAGNCGSPLETESGWLVLTHGVGPMRRYAIGALLLDLHEPQHVIAELPGTLLTPDDAEREGYVPNVVYSCGGLLHAGALWLPYGASDARIGFAHVALTTLMEAMRRPR